MRFDNLASAYLAGSTWLSDSGIQSNLEGPINPAVSDNEFLWDQVPAYPELVYHDCFGSYQCARLEVPMDWNASKHEDNRTVEIAVIRIPAIVPVTDPRYGGALAINPGGPGGSGIALALKVGRPIQTVLSAPSNATTGKYFDVISFDPRGVNNTRPFFSCFPDYISAITFGIENDAAGVFDSSDVAFDMYWARNREMAADCSRRAVELGIGEHMATASVARDIIEIFERHGEWREEEARRLLGLSSSGAASQGSQVVMAETQKEVLERVKYRRGEEMVQYWGFSYGTILGATLAAMYPERIHRAILDGVADSFDYMRGGWLTNLQDTDLQMVKFAEYCWQGGIKNCALYHEDGPAAILETFANITTTLFSNPIGVPPQNGSAATVATYSDLKHLFWDKTYAPLKEFPTVARIMAELANGNGTGLVANRLARSKALKKGLPTQCELDGPYTPACFNHTAAGFDLTVGAGILCSDAEPQANVSKNEYWTYVKELMGQSRLMGDVWATIRLPCTAWSARPKWRYNGTFEAQTAHPILWVGNSIDNVTPVRNAHRMAKGFEGSVVLQQDGEGHCSTAGLSFCTMKTLRTYFQNGTLPEKGRVCGVDRVPLDGAGEDVEMELPEGETDEEMWRAMIKLVWH